MFRFMKILLLSVVVWALALGSAWADLEDTFDWDAPYVSMKHVTRSSLINGKTKYNLTDADISAGANPQYRAPAMYYMYMPINSNVQLAGTNPKLVITTSAASYATYYDVVTSAALGKITPEETIRIGAKTFSIWPYPDDNTSYYAGVEEGYGVEYINSADIDSEQALSGASFTLTFNNAATTGVLGTIRTAGDQMESGCAPYVSLTMDGAALSKVNWKFVSPGEVDNNPNVVPAALKQSAENDVIRVRQVLVRMSDGSGITRDISKSPATDELLEGAVDYADAKIQGKDILYVELTFSYADRLSTGCATEYKWRFYQSGVEYRPDQLRPDKPTEAEVEAAANKANLDLATKLTEVVAAEQTNLKMGTEVTLGDETKARTSSVIAMSQTAAEGGAVLLAASEKLVMPSNSKSLNDADLPKPADFSELTQNYHVYKFFEETAYVDLLAEYGSDLFSYNSDTGVTMKAAVMVINDVAPAKAEGDGILRPDDVKYGVKFVSGSNVLYIWDGVKNDVASDPIALVRSNEGSSGSGCNAGFGIFVLLAVGGLLVSRKK